MSEDLAAQLCRRLSALETQRSSWDERWQRIAQRILPQHAIFQHNHSLLPPERRVELNYDTTGGQALIRFGAILGSIMTPKQERWHSLQPSDPSLKRSYRTQLYLEAVRDLLFRRRYAHRSGFASAIGEAYVFLGAFGVAPMMIEDDPGRGIRYRTVHLAETFLTTDHTGLVDGVWRKYRMTARQAMQRFPGQIPPELQRKIDQELKQPSSSPETEFWFAHIVLPATDMIPGADGPAGFPIRSHYLSVETKEHIGSGGFAAMPYAVPRYMSSGTPYGWGPGLLVLPEVQTANEMRKTLLRQGQIIVDPPILAHGSNDSVMEPFNVRPGHVNYGFVNPDGKQMAVPFISGGNLADGREELAAARQQINSAFLVDLFQILIQKPNMTATEVLQWAQEKADLIAPTMDRLQEELLGPIIERELSILAMAGELPEMPPELREAGGEVSIQYEGPLSRFQRSGEAAGFARTIEVTAGMGQLYPEIYDNFDRDTVLREVATIQGTPASWLRDPDMVAQERAQRAQQQERMLAEQNLPGKAAAAKSLAQAEQIGAEAA